MADAKNGKVITLICERSVDLDGRLDENSRLKEMPDVQVVKFPCSGMIQPLMVEAAFKAGAAGVIVCGCQIGDCYYREGNKMIRERLLGERPPGLKKTVDRQRVVGLWLAKPQVTRFLSEAREFLSMVHHLGLAAASPAPAKPAPAPKPAVSDKSKAEPKAEEPKPNESKTADSNKTPADGP